MDAATARATDGTAALAVARASTHSETDGTRRAGNVVHLPVPRRGHVSLVDGYTRSDWGGVITIVPITGSQHPADKGAAELIVTEHRGVRPELVAAAGRGDLLRLRLPASPDADITALLAEAEAHLSAYTDRGDREHRRAQWARGVIGTWRAAVSDLMLLAVETASMRASEPLV